MAFDSRSLDDYVDVATRLAELREVYPEARVRPADPAAPFRIVQVECMWCRQCIDRRVVKTGRDSWKDCPRCQGSGLRAAGEPVLDTFIVVVAACYRTPDDPHPGIGMAWEPYPGQTPYTANRELMNAETSAWRRAIEAALTSSSRRGVASREEVRNRAAEHDAGDVPAAASRRAPNAWADPEHTRLVHSPPAAEGPAPGVERLNGTPEGDPWQGPPPAAAEVEGRPGTVDPADLRKIHMHFGRLLISDRVVRLAETEKVIGRKVPTSNNLSFQEGRRLVAELESRPTP